MANNSKLTEAGKLLKEIEDIYNRLGEKNPWKDVKEASVNLNKLKEDLKEAKDYLSLMSERSDELVSSFRAINDEISSSNKLYNVGVSSLGSLTSISTKLRDSQQKINTLSSDQVKTLQKKLNSEKSSLEGLQRQLSKKKELTDISEKEAALLKNINGLLDEQDSALQSLTSELQEELQIREKIEKSMGITGGILKGIAKIPIVGNMLGTQKALEAASEAAEQGAGRLGTMSAAAKSMGKSFMTSLSDPLVIIGAITKGFKMAWDTMMGLDKQAEEFARSMNISYREALNVREEMANIRDLNRLSLANAKDYLETISFVGNQLGSNAQLNEKDLETFTKLRIQAGLTNEELMGAQRLSLANGNSLESNVDTILKTTSALNKQKGVYLNEKTILKEIGNVSAATTLSLGKSQKEIAKAVTTAKALGMEMSKVEDIAGSLLDFESSIENELSAELLLGKNINLERARQLALNNDIAGVAEEINAQIGSSADYTEMNRIQQEELAKAVGMNREELAQTLFTQEQLRGLGKDEAARRQAVLDKRIEEVGLAQAQRELEQDGIEKLEAQYGISTQLEQAVTRIKEQFAEFILPVLEKILDSSGGIKGLWNTISGSISNIISKAKLLFQVLMSIKAAQLAYNAASVISLAIQKKQASASKQEAGAEIVSASAKTFGGIPIVGLALAAAAAIATFAGLSSLMNDGVISPTTGGGGYGSRVLFGPEGAISFNNKDTIVAGTNLFNKGDDVISSGKGSIQMGGSREVVDAINNLKQSVNALASRPVNVSIDGEKVIKATTGANPNTDSDEMNKNSFKTQ
jgi:vacuolar-type H+-ATPase subunit D/Vma8